MTDDLLPSTEVGRIVADQDGRPYVLTRTLGKGGQGTVYFTDQQGALVKLFRDSSHEPDEALRRVRRMPLQGLAVTAPIGFIEGGTGYVMRFQREMVSARSLRWADLSTDLRDFWIDSGGLSRRLCLAARASLVIEQLHARGLVYGDLNDLNLLVSEDPAFDMVTLIDLDNLAYARDPRAPAVYYPFFGAPELANGHTGPSFATDNFSLAVLIFEMITTVQPFRSGNLVGSAPEGSRILVDAERCMVPSVIDPDDDSNRCLKYPIQSAERLIAGPLLRLLQQALGPGRRDPALRPAAALLRSACVDALADCVVCESCSWSYPRSVDRACPNCGDYTPTVELGLGFPGATHPSRRIRIGIRPRTFDLGLAFPTLLDSEPLPGLFNVRFSAFGSDIRARAEHDGRVSIPSVMSNGDRIEVSGLGKLVATVSRQ